MHIVQIIYHLLEFSKNKYTSSDCYGTFVLKKLEIIRNIQNWEFNTVPYVTILSVLLNHRQKYRITNHRLIWVLKNARQIIQGRR